MEIRVDVHVLTRHDLTYTPIRTLVFCFHYHFHLRGKSSCGFRRTTRRPRLAVHFSVSFYDSSAFTPFAFSLLRYTLLPVLAAVVNVVLVILSYYWMLND